MLHAQLFEASTGMYIAGYIAKFCGEQGIPYDDMTSGLSRRVETNPSDTAASPAKTSHIARISYYIGISIIRS